MTEVTLKSEGLPAAYFLSKEELQSLGGDPGQYTDEVAAQVNTLQLMLNRPAMFTGKRDPQLLLLLLVSELGNLTHLCRTLPGSDYWDQLQLGASGPWELLRRNQDSVENQFTELNKLVQSLLEWIPRHQIINQWNIKLASENASVIAMMPEIQKIRTLLKEKNQLNQTIVEGPAWRPSTGEKTLEITVINRKLDPNYWWDASKLKRTEQFLC